jgi:hypothetical protein
MKDLWLDIGAANNEEAAKLVRIGDAVTVELAFRTLQNQLAISPAMDDKAGCWVVIEALRRACKSKRLTCGLYAVSTVQEELGLRGGRSRLSGGELPLDSPKSTLHGRLFHRQVGPVDRQVPHEGLGRRNLLFHSPRVRVRAIDGLQILLSFAAMGLDREPCGPDDPFRLFELAQQLEVLRTAPAVHLVIERGQIPLEIREFVRFVRSVLLEAGGLEAIVIRERTEREPLLFLLG